MNFSPANQDAYADRELKSIHAVRDASHGKFEEAMADAGTRWQSMPGSNLGGKQIPLTRAVDAFLKSAAGCR
jgi:muramidase (phage lysozyme)